MINTRSGGSIVASIRHDDNALIGRQQTIKMNSKTNARNHGVMFMFRFQKHAAARHPAARNRLNGMQHGSYSLRSLVTTTEYVAATDTATKKAPNPTPADR
jgi:hypothetical protein